MGRRGKGGGFKEANWEKAKRRDLNRIGRELDSRSAAQSGSGNDGKVYETRESRYDGKTDHFFNESGSFDDPHGHVVEGRDSTPGQTTYDYVRDADGDEYINR